MIGVIIEAGIECLRVEEAFHPDDAIRWKENPVGFTAAYSLMGTWFFPKETIPFQIARLLMDLPHPRVVQRKAG